MPTERYFHLSEEKKRRISGAVVRDFQNNDYRDLKVSRIAEQIQLSRRGLYTYFRGKPDMLHFAVVQIWSDFFEFNKESLIVHSGDYWAMLADGLEYFLHRNGRMPMDLVMFSCSRNMAREYAEWLFWHVDRRNMRLQTKDEFAALQELCHTLVSLAVHEYQTGASDMCKIRKDFITRLGYIKTGFLRTEERTVIGDRAEGDCAESEKSL